MRDSSRDHPVHCRRRVRHARHPRTEQRRPRPNFSTVFSAGHPDKSKEIGSEATPAAFIDRLLDVVEACDRVLAPHGSLVFELGDTYAGSGGAGGDYGTGGLRDGAPKFNGSALADRKNKVLREDGNRLQQGDGWPEAKSLCGIPQLFMLSLAYGQNMLQPERQTPRWRVRNVVAWCRPNPPVGALADKYRPATSFLTVACKQRDRYFDLDAVRTPHRRDYSLETKRHGIGPAETNRNHGRDEYTNSGNEAGAPPLDWWQIPTQPYPGAHYATWPEQLCVTPIKSMCPQRVCTVCGKPSRRIVEHDYKPDDSGGGSGHTDNGCGQIARRLPTRLAVATETLGWSDCGHNQWRPGLVLDPFAGSGTTLQVATGHGLDAIGIDLDPRNAQLAVDRVGPLLLTVETLKEVAS
jgi:hypothetical protein